MARLKFTTCRCGTTIATTNLETTKHWNLQPLPHLWPVLYRHILPIKRQAGWHATYTRHRYSWPTRYDTPTHWLEEHRCGHPPASTQPPITETPPATSWPDDPPY